MLGAAANPFNLPPAFCQPAAPTAQCDAGAHAYAAAVGQFIRRYRGLLRTHPCDFLTEAPLEEALLAMAVGVIQTPVSIFH
jgi:hypothetical protein